MRHLESHLQQICLKWARLQYPLCRVLLFSVPNGAHLSQVQARILKAEGMTAGVPDMIFMQHSADYKYACLCIEFKTEKGRQSEHQKAFEEALPKDYRYDIVRSFEQFKELIDYYLTGI